MLSYPPKLYKVGPPSFAALTLFGTAFDSAPKTASPSLKSVTPLAPEAAGIVLFMILPSSAITFMGLKKPPLFGMSSSIIDLMAKYETAFVIL